MRQREMPLNIGSLAEHLHHTPFSLANEAETKSTDVDPNNPNSEIG
jgi:hypothetical protein